MKINLINTIMSKNYWQGFKGRFVSVIILGAIVVGSGMYLSLPVMLKKANEKTFAENTKVLSVFLKEAIFIYIEFQDYNSIQNTFDKIGEQEHHIYRLKLVNNKTDEILSEYTSKNEEKLSDQFTIDYALDFSINGTPYVLTVSVDNTRQKEVMRQIKTNLMYLVLSSIILIVFAAIILINVLTRPLDTAVLALKDITSGEGDLTQRLDAKRSDEFGELAVWFNTFVEQLQTIVGKIKDSSTKVGKTTEHISTVSEEMASGAEEQQGDLSEMTIAIEEMSASIMESSQNTSETQGNTKRATNTATEGHEMVSQTFKGIEGIVGIVEKAAAQISSLEKRSKEIGAVIQVIDEIADQTNLLALNANIEAARAGDAGRGFAVVADEVRKLAERTVTATGDIGKEINQIQHDIDSAVQAMNQIKEETSKGQQSAEESGESLNSIVEVITLVNNAVDEISSGAEEQSRGIEEISNNIEKISSVSKHSASGAQEMATSAQTLNEEVDSLTNLIDHFKIS